MNWSKLIKDLRSELLVNQEELARMLGIAFCTVNRYENDRFIPRPAIQRKLKRLCLKANVNFERYR